jgi:3-isopropylmalate/(R)-2-methylmalate dehydratase large subunit
MRVEFQGTFRPGVYPKDAILKLISTIGIGGANGHIIEYTGSAVASMSMEERLTVCNMSIECGARAGLIAPDETTYSYLKGRPYAPKPEQWDKAVEYWKSLRSDPGCEYDREVIIDIDLLEPMITWGTNPEQGCFISDMVPTVQAMPESRRDSAQRALEYVGLTEGTPLTEVKVDWAFVGSCTNGRIEDLRIVAETLKGKKVNPNVTFYIVPGSEQVHEMARREGLDSIFIEAGAEFRLPGCSMCLGMNDDKVPAGKRCISSSNRNFVGRQGTGSITHLASPATVAASAIAGCITASPSFSGE